MRTRRTTACLPLTLVPFGNMEDMRAVARLHLGAGRGGGRQQHRQRQRKDGNAGVQSGGSIEDHFFFGVNVAFFCSSSSTAFLSFGYQYSRWQFSQTLSIRLPA
jgi:hypothetical protein